MARFNTVVGASTASGSTAIATPNAGLFTAISGSSGVTITLPPPAQNVGSQQSIYNGTSGTITLANPSGNIVGLGTANGSTLLMQTGALLTLINDGTDYYLGGGAGGGAIVATTITASGTVALNAAVNINPASFNVSISPTGTGTVAISPAGALTINPTTASTINNCSIGASTRGSGAFTTLAANNGLTVSSGSTSVQGFSCTTFSASAIDNTPIGASTRSTGAFTTLGANNTVSFTAGTASTSTTSGTLQVTGGVGVTGALYCTSLVETSSIAFKENINPLAGALDSILQLTGVTYDRKDNKKHEAGLIAEDVFKVIPDLVSLDEKGNPYGIQYTKLTAYLVECIKSLKDEINELKGKK